jgi:transposase
VPGAKVTAVARRNGVAASAMSTWRRQAQLRRRRARGMRSFSDDARRLRPVPAARIGGSRSILASGEACGWMPKSTRMLDVLERRLLPYRAMCGFGLRRAIPTCGAFPSFARPVQESLKRDPHAAVKSRGRSSSISKSGCVSGEPYTPRRWPRLSFQQCCRTSLARCGSRKKEIGHSLVLTLAAIVSLPSIPCLPISSVTY